MGYIRIPIETDVNTLVQSVYAQLQAQDPDWVPQDGNLDVWIIKAVCALAVENRSIASDVQDDIFRYLGMSLFGIPPIDAVSAVGTTTWILNDTNGHTIPAGTTVSINDSSGNPVYFATVVDVVVPMGNSSTGAGEVVISAITPGAAGSGIGTTNGPVNQVTVLDWVATNGITLVAPTAGGQDDETDAVYLSRLVRRLQRLSERPILPEDFANMALDASTEVQRVVAIDGYNPSDSTYNNERMITIVAVTSAGAGVSSIAKTAIETLLQSNRETTFVVNVIDPNFTTINVAATIVVLPGFDPTAVNTAATAAINAYLSPATWGQDPAVTDAGASQTWIETPTLYYNEMITVISNVEGVARVTALTLNTTTGNITLTTPAALTQPGTIAVTN